MSLSVQDFLDKQISLADQLNLLNLCPLIQPEEMAEFARFQVELKEEDGEQDFKGPINNAFINIYEYNYFLDIMNSIFINHIANHPRVGYVQTYILNSIILSLFLNTEFYNNDYDFASESESQELYKFFIDNRGIANTIKSKIDLCIKNFLISVEKESQFIEFNTKLTEIFEIIYEKVYVLFTLYPDDDYPYLDLYFGILNFPYVENDLGTPTYNIKCASDSNVINICERIKYLLLNPPLLGDDFPRDFSEFTIDLSQFIDLYFKYYGNLLETFQKLPITVAPNVAPNIAEQILRSPSPQRTTEKRRKSPSPQRTPEKNTRRRRLLRPSPKNVGGKLTVKANKKKLFKKTKKKKLKKGKHKKHFKSKKQKKHRKNIKKSKK